MRIAELLGGVAIFLGTCACSSSSSQPDQVASDLTCAAGQIRVQGMLGSFVADLEDTITSYSFENKLSADRPGRVNALTTRGQLLLEFDTLTANGHSSHARGSYADSMVGSAVGNCETGAFVSELSVDSDGEGVHFLLRELHGSPYCVTSAPIDGTLSGCVRSSFNP